MDYFFTSTSINVVQQICTIVNTNTDFDKKTNGIYPFVLTNTAAAGARKTWSLTITNNLQKDVTWTKWYILCNNVKSAEFTTKFIFSPTALAKGTTPAAMTGTYYSNAQSITFSASAWFTNVATNTGVKCTFTADSKAGSNISFT